MWFEKALTDSIMSARRYSLTRREGQLVSLLSQGLKNKEIATALTISEGTVKVYLSRLFQKLGVKDRFELALYGLKNLTPGGGSMEHTQHGNPEGWPSAVAATTIFLCRANPCAVTASTGTSTRESIQVLMSDFSWGRPGNQIAFTASGFSVWLGTVASGGPLLQSLLPPEVVGLLSIPGRRAPFAATRRFGPP